MLPDDVGTLSCITHSGVARPTPSSRRGSAVVRALEQGRPPKAGFYASIYNRHFVVLVHRVVHGSRII